MMGALIATQKMTPNFKHVIECHRTLGFSACALTHYFLLLLFNFRRLQMYLVHSGLISF